MHAQDTTLRHIQNRSAQKRAENPAIGDGKSAAFEIGKFEFIFLDLVDVIDNVLF